MAEDTLLQRRRNSVRICREETLMLLRAYREHPTSWADVIATIKYNLNQLPERARALYTTASNRKLKDRLSTKLAKLIASRNIEDDDIRREVNEIRTLERRQLSRVRRDDDNLPAAAQQPEAAQQPAATQQPAVVQQEVALQQPEAAQEPEPAQQPAFAQQEVAAQPQQAQEPARQPVPVVAVQQAGPAREGRRDRAAAALSSDDEDEGAPPQRRRLYDLIRENHELYNVFMTRRLPDQILND